MAGRPSFSLVAGVLVLAACSMIVAVYFGGTGRIPQAMVGTILFVGLGGLGFELARRRSL
jgi:hypothetical protein